MHSGIALALPGLLPARQDPAPLLRLLRPRHDRLRRSDNHLLQRGEQNIENSFQRLRERDSRNLGHKYVSLGSPYIFELIWTCEIVAKKITLHENFHHH